MDTPTIPSSAPAICMQCHGMVPPAGRRALATLTPMQAGADVLVDAVFHPACLDAFDRRPAWRVVAVCEYIPTVEAPRRARGAEGGARMTMDALRRQLERYGATVDPHGSGLNVTCSPGELGTEDLAALVPAGFIVRYTLDGFIVEAPDDEPEVPA